MCFCFCVAVCSSTLADEFALFNNWHSAIPGPTFVNRAFADSGTSNGMAENDVLDIIFGYPQRTIYQVQFARLSLFLSMVCVGTLPHSRNVTLVVCACVGFSTGS